MNEQRLEGMERDEEIRREQGGKHENESRDDFDVLATALINKYPNDERASLRNGIIDALRSAFQGGRDYEKTLYHFAGTDACRSCQTGRFTLFFRTNLCIECANEMKAAIKKQQDVGE